MKRKQATENPQQLTKSSQSQQNEKHCMKDYMKRKWSESKSQPL